MAHHGPKPLLDGEDQEAHARLKKELLKNEHLLQSLGATGEFPQGKLAEHDEGELQFAIGVRDGKVVIEFGKPVHWVGMDRHQAMQLGEMLIAKADQCLLIQKTPDRKVRAQAG